MEQPPYTLLIATGQSPQVITETIFELKRAEERRPAAVHVVTTEAGRAYGEALLFGKERTDPTRGTDIAGAEARWPAFCDEVLDTDAVDLTFHVPEVDGQGLTDIRKKGDDTHFANLCYRLVERLTREDQLPLIGSVAGGRKTMSAHLMTAFSVYGRPNDQLTHVLLTDPSKESSDFFYPKTGSPGFSYLLDLVDIRFPQLRPLLESDLIEDLPDDRRDLEGILDALEPHVNSARTVADVRMELRDENARLVFEGPTDTLDTCRLSPKQTATLLVFAERRAAAGEPVPNTSLVGNDTVEAQRTAVRWAFSSDTPFDPWAETDDLSKSVSALNDALRRVPVAERLLEVQGLSGRPHRYDWPGEAPPLTIAARHPGEDWPFDHVPAPERLN